MQRPRRDAPGPAYHLEDRDRCQTSQSSQSQTERNIRRLRGASAVAYLLAFGLLAVTMTYAIVRVQSAHQHVEQVMALHNEKLRLITETQVASFRRADTVQQLILETGPFAQDDIYMAYLKYGFMVGDGRNRIRVLLQTPAEKAVMAQQDRIIAEAVVLHEDIADLARAGDFNAARSIFVERVARLHEEGHATFQALRDLQTEAAALANGAANAYYEDTLKKSVMAILASFLISISIGLLMHHMSGRISKRLRANVGDLRYMALHDSLTGLLNRNAITQLIEQQIHKGERFALLYMDLDGFKKANDVHGHHLGDHFLMMAAARIRGRMRGIDTVARIGGDEFVALMRGINDVDECRHAANHIIQAFEPAFVHDAASVRIGISIGIAVAPGDGHSAAQILHAADQAMYKAKKRGSNCYEIYTHPDLAIVG